MNMLKGKREKMNNRSSLHRGELERRLLLFLLLTLCPMLLAPISAQEHLPDYYVQRAEGYLPTNSWQELKHEVDEGLKFYPDNPDLRYLNGRYFYTAKNLHEARYNLVRATQNDDQHFKAKRLLVDVEDDLKHYTSAICYINELLEFQPYDRDLWRRKIGLYRKIGNEVQANSALERLAHIYPNDTVVREELRNQHRQSWNSILKKSNLREAAEDLERWIDLDPHNLSYYLELASIQERLGEYERALGTVNRGLHEFPNDGELVHKALGIMTELGLYTQALSFAKQHGGTGQLYAGLLREVADDARLHDAYEANGRLYATTHDHDALNYLINTALTRGYYDDARYYLAEAMSQEGRTAALLMKLYDLERRFGNEEKAFKILEELYTKNPDDEELTENYAALMLQLGSHEMEGEQWLEARKHLARALDLITPEQEVWPALVARQITVLGHLGKYSEARALYHETALQTDKENAARFAATFEEIVGNRLRLLIAEEQYEQALAEAQALAEDLPSSEVALRTCINMSQTLERNDLFQQYAQKGYELHPNVPYFVIKQAISLQQQHREADALALVSPKQGNDEWRNPQLKAAYSGIASDWAAQLFKSHMPDIALQVVDSALVYDPKNKELLYTKGLAHEKLKQFSQAYELQRRNYEPGNAEQQEFYEHMRYLGFRSLKNRVDASYTYAAYDTREGNLATIAHLYSIATFTYSCLLQRDAITGQISYKGIDGQPKGTEEELEAGEEFEAGGVGLEFMGQWEHTFGARWSGMASLAWSTRYFNTWSGNLSATYSADKDWNFSLRLGYRRTPKSYIFLNSGNNYTLEQERYHLFLLSPSVEKAWSERIRTTANADLAIIRSGFYYNIGVKGKLFFKDDNISSVALLTSLGTFPELTFFEQTALQRLSHLNAMVGFDAQYLLTRHLYIGLTGSWNTCYDPYRRADGSMVNHYRNIYTICAQLHLAF